MKARYLTTLALLMSIAMLIPSVAEGRLPQTIRGRPAAAEASSTADVPSHIILFSDQGLLYALDPRESTVEVVGSDVAVPPSLLVTPVDDVYTDKEWPDDIVLSEGYRFLHALLSPEGNRLVYAEAVCNGDDCIADYRMWLVDLGNHTRQQIFDANTGPASLLLDPVAWSATTDKIVFNSFEPAANAPYRGLWVYNLETNSLSRLDLGFGGYNGRVWLSPDQRYLLFPGFDGGETSPSPFVLGTPTNLVKTYDLVTGDVRVHLQHPQSGEYAIHGWMLASNLDSLKQMSMESPLEASDSPVPPAISGFQRPMTNDHYGWEWLECNDPENGCPPGQFHPGVDYNGEGWGDADCGIWIYAVANGKVRYRNTASWGGLVVEHNWQGLTVYSQYAHISTAYVAEGDNVTKGDHIADMGKVGTLSCHLHWEIREADHPDPTNGSYWHKGVLGSKKWVKEYYEDPEWWVDNHGPYFFTDVPEDHEFYDYIEALHRAGYVAGCSEDPFMYCPDQILNRAEMAVFVERGVHGAGYEPGPSPVQFFADVPPNAWYTGWVNALWRDGYTAGCGTDPLIYCPDWDHIRAEAAVFFVRMRHGPDYEPRHVSGIFEDVPLDAWYAPWVEAAYTWGLMECCLEFGDSRYFCPLASPTRGETARIMVRAMGGLPLMGAEGTDADPLVGDSLSFGSSNDGTSQPLPPAPTLRYSTYLGGVGHDVGNSVAVDNAGHVYVVGYSDSSDFPVTENALQPANNGDRDAFIAKLRPNSNEPVYITYLGGSGLDEGYSVAVDSMGNATIMGCTDSLDFPTRNPLQPTHGGGRDLFVAKLSASGDLVYSTYLGGSSTDEGYNLAVDSEGNAYIAGRTFSDDFPTSDNPWQGSNAGRYDAFVTKLSSSGELVYSTYLGGSGTDAAHGLAADSSGNAYVTGDTGSTDFPTTENPLQDSKGGGHDAFVAKLNASGNQLIYGTYLGGSGGDFGRSIAVDGTGNAYVTGHTASTDFPTASPLQNSHGGGFYDLFAAKLSASGNGLVYSTYLGDSGGDEGDGIVVDNTGAACVTGLTSSLDFPTAGPLPTSASGSRDMFVAKLEMGGSKLLYSLYLGGSAGDHGDSIAADGAGNVYATGYTLSANFPTANPLQTGFGGYRDAFIVQISEKHTTYLPLILE